MREIKFRGKRVDNGEWVYGNPVEWLNETKDISIIAHPFGCCIDEKGNLVLIEAPFVCKVIPVTIGQFTGLHDKNGKEIYEGDIVKCVSELFSNFGKYPTGKFNTSYYEICEMEDDAYCFGTRRIGKEYISRGILRACAEKFYEVIGNVHDNPELLKEVSHEA